MELHKKYEKILELDKVLKRLCEYAVLNESKERLENIKPETSLIRAQKKLEKADGAFLLLSRFGLPEFENVKNPSFSLKRAADGVTMSTGELLNIAKILQQSQKISSWWKSCKNVNSSLSGVLSSLSAADAGHPLYNFKKEISRSIASEDQIADEASSELKEIRRQLRHQRSQMEESLNKYLKGDLKKYLQDSFTTMRDNRYVLPVRTEFRSQVPGLVHGASSSGGTVFIEPMSVVEANNQIRLLLAQEEEEIAKILFNLTQQAVPISDELIREFDSICYLDQCFAKARFAQEINGSRPILNDRGILSLKQARHPLISPKTVVPIDLEMGRGIQSFIITGPNTGGKTVALKTAGLLTLMAMCGLLIPANEGSEVAVCSHVLADIGDEQSIEQSLSTFSSHMRNLVEILNQVDENSLVLLDELGSGTDPTEGAALAISILEEIHQKGARLIATTHYPELKLYAIATKGVENASCEFDIKHMKPTYRLLIGQPGSSNAFAVSQHLGLPEKILDRAKKLLSQGDRNLQESILRLEQMEREKERALKKAKSERQAAEKLRREMEEQTQRMNTKIENEWDSAREKASYLLENMQGKIHRLTDELESYWKDKASPKEAQRKLQSKLDNMMLEADPVPKKIQEPYKLPRELQKGDLVLLADMQREAVVLKPVDSSGNVLVQFGSMKLHTPSTNLRLKEKPKQKERKTSAQTMNVKRMDSLELDLRGMTAEEGLNALDQFLDHCVLSNIQQCRIIHGKGTGKLRTAVQNHLKSHPSVANFRLGNFGEGDSGVTIAELK